MLLNKKSLAIGLALVLGLNVTGCSKNDAESKTGESVTTASAKSNYVAKEQAILDKNTPPIHAQANPDAIKLIPHDFQLAEKGYLTVAVISLVAPPLRVLASDNKTNIGADIDLARLIADSLDLKLKIVPSAWENWPLGISSGKFDVAITNITVTKERKEKFDFATYKKDLLGFYTAKKNDLKEIKDADDIAGLKIIVGAATNQEKVLLDWIADNKRKGLQPAQPVYMDDQAAAALALQSGRADATFGPIIGGAWQVANGADIKLIGQVDGGWPKTAEIGVVVKKGNGLVNAIQAAINGVIQSGEYKQAYTRWGIQNEALEESLINPPGLGD
ncbi:transporter substrate-binding domain-containing protein [Acinetobacter puyangensis]|uniref:transporter substrate-binding domain-containing protein n=1 Tax=Acinetobacter puyangensis TaxID=1096779 RepID=UPI003A4D2ACB